MTKSQQLLLERARYLAWHDLQPMIRANQHDYVDQHFMSIVLDYYTRLLTQEIITNYKKSIAQPKKSTAQKF